MSVLRAAGWLILGAVIPAASSWTFFEWHSAPAAAADAARLARRAAVAHAIYAPEVRHPVEVTADQEPHLVSAAHCALPCASAPCAALMASPATTATRCDGLTVVSFRFPLRA